MRIYEPGSGNTSSEASAAILSAAPYWGIRGAAPGKSRSGLVVAEIP